MRASSLRLAAAWCLVMVAFTACGGDAGEATDPAAGDAGEASTAAAGSEPSPTDDEPAGSATAADFCTALSGVSGHFDLLEISLDTDWEETVLALREAEAELAAIEPPDQLGADWADVTAFYTLIVGAFEGVDLADDAAVQAVIEERFGPETEEAATTAQAAIGRIDSYAEKTCVEGSEPAPAPVDGCALLPADALSQRVFVTTQPTAEPRSHGEGQVECIWSDGTSEVSLMLIPREEFEREYVARSTPLTEVPIDDLAGGLAYQGTLGIGRFSTRGHSVSFIAGDRGGFVSVQIRDTGSRPVEVGEAARLARLLVAGL